METKKTDTPPMSLYINKTYPDVFHIWFNEYQMNLMEKLQSFLLDKEMKKDRELIFIPRGGGATSILEYYRTWICELDFYCEIEIKEHHSDIPQGCIIEIISKRNLIKLN